MGVKGLWQLLQPVGRPVTLESLEGKVLSVDASILLNQAVKGMRDKSGNPLPNAHLVVLFNRLCKLLFYKIKPIFIFDGGVPILKKKTLAVRRERKFKAKHGSNKATEKMVKNYLKGKALETVTGKKSIKTILKNDGQRDPDIFELPPMNQESRQESSSSEAEDDDGVEQFYSQQDFEKKFQDPSSINVDSQDFRSLPEEVQHELIKDVMEERKWTTIQSMPQDAFGFSDYQLQNVLQRGKLHQRLDELRKEMSNRNNGEVSGLSSQQDALGADSSVLSQRIVSEDSGHYVLIKTSKNGSNENQDTPMIDSLSEGGFFLEDQKAPPQQTKRTIPSQVPSFEVDLTCEAASSDSEVDVSLLDVPEVVVLDLDEPHEKRGDGEGEERNAKAEDGGREDMVEDSLQDQSVGVFKKINDEVLKGEAKKVDRNSEDNISLKDNGLEQENRITVEETQDELSLNKEETEECDFIQAQIARRRNQIEMLLSKRQSASHLSTCEEVCEKSVQSDESSPITSSPGEDIAAPVTNEGTLPVEDGGIEFRLRLESSSDEDEEDKDDITARDHEETSKIDPMEEVEGIQETQHDDLENFKVKELEKDSTDVTGQKEDVQVIDHQHDRDEKVKESTMEEEEGMEIEEISCAREESLVPDEKPTEVETRSSLVQAPSEFAGTSKEDLEVMQVSLGVEQQSLQTERARQERLAATVSNEMLTECQELLRLFGVPYLVSPMEAEAQCAFLDFTQQTNGSITDDSDVFLFGGTRVYKNIFNQNKHAELYTIDAITGHLALDRSKMINLAFITGSDYTEGIQGLGAVGAMEVLHEFSSEGFEALIKFKKWHDETKKNRNSTQETNVKKKLRKLTLPTGFPSQEVFDSYVNPVIDESREAFEWGKPDLHGLRLFAKEKLGWSAEKTDEILLPVLKQLNKQENQMRMEDFFQIKFHEPKKKPSRRVRRVINQFHNPLSSSDSSSEDEGKTPGSSQSNITKGRVKETGSRNKMTVSRVARGRGRGQSRGRRVNDGSSGRDVNDRPIVSNHQLESGTMKDSDAGGVEGRGSALVGGKPKKEGRKIGKRNMVGKGKISNQELHMRDKGKGSMTDKVDCDVNALEKDNDMIKNNSKTQGDHNDKDKPNNLSFNLEKNENYVSMLQRNNVKNLRYKIPKKISTTKKDESGSSRLGNENDDSSTSSDSDSEEARSNCPSSGNLSRTNKNGGRGMGRKRTRGRGRGRGAGAVKRSKIEKMP